jgi:hypothetical protein
MRLLCSDSLQLFEFFEADIPQYVILSHTWGQDEVTFQDIQNLEKATRKKGFRKLEGCCKKAQSDGFQWVWIDTCCIDKSSSAELSEAINSMYQWYMKSQICYAYMEDVHSEEDFSRSRWFKRGWTLQELIAPSFVEFYTVEWVEIGTKMSLAENVSRITAIDESVLEDSSQMAKINIASRMSWASERETTRIEDQAYCLMGLFGINMPLLYGEGRRAFHRLQEEIMKMHEDYTLFAWADPGASMAGHCNPVESLTSYHLDGILAESPRSFSKKKWPQPWWPYSQLYPSIMTAALANEDIKHSITGWQFVQPPTITSRGLSIGLPTRRIGLTRYQVCLTCTDSLANVHFLCLTLRLSSSEEHPPEILVCSISDTGQLEFIPQVKLKRNTFKYTQIYITHTMFHSAIFEPDGLIRQLSERWLKVQTDENCSILESDLLCQDHSEKITSNEFLLNCPFYDYQFHGDGRDLQGMFKIGSQDFSPPFIVGFGTRLLRHRAPWCGVLFEPHVRYGDEVLPLKLENLEKGLANAKSVTRFAVVQNALLKDMEMSREIRSRMFEVPLSEIFPGCRLSNAHHSKHNLDLFNLSSDRVVKYLSGITVRASVRRFGGSVRHLSICWGPLPKSI